MANTYRCPPKASNCGRFAPQRVQRVQAAHRGHLLNAYAGLWVRHRRIASSDMRRVSDDACPMRRTSPVHQHQLQCRGSADGRLGVRPMRTAPPHSAAAVSASNGTSFPRLRAPCRTEPFSGRWPPASLSTCSDGHALFPNIGDRHVEKKGASRGAFLKRRFQQWRLVGAIASQLTAARPCNGVREGVGPEP